MKFEEVKDDYIKLWNSVQVTNPNPVGYAFSKLVQNKARYEAVSKSLGGLIPWHFIGIIHSLESDFNFKTHLHNGDPLTARTVQVPAGRPKTGNPPFTWEYSADDALRMKGYDKETEWDIPHQLYRFEKYNGWRSRTLHKINTPYLWSMTNHYKKGKYVKDNKWDPNAVSRQVGAAALLTMLK